MKKKLLAMLLTLCMVLTMLPTMAFAADDDADNDFVTEEWEYAESELEPEKPSSWAAEQVNAAIAAGLVPASLQSGYTSAITRAEFCALAVALYETAMGTEITERATFDDTDDLNVQKMAGLGVVNGVGEGKFNPNDKLTREQAAVILARLSEVMGNPLDKVAATFADNGDVSDWALEAVGQMQASGIMGGVGDNTFSPKSDYTREQSILTTLRLEQYEIPTDTDTDFFDGTGIWLRDDADLSDGVEDDEVLILWRAAPPSNYVNSDDHLYTDGYIMYSLTPSTSPTKADIFIGAIGGYDYDVTLNSDSLLVDWYNVTPSDRIFMESKTFTQVLTDVDETSVTLEEVKAMLAE